MRRQIGVAAALAGFAFVLAGARPALRADVQSSVEDIRKELMQLPYYSVFDFLAFSYDKGTVTLSGYAYQSTLKHDAAHAAPETLLMGGAQLSSLTRRSRRFGRELPARSALDRTLDQSLLHHNSLRAHGLY